MVGTTRLELATSAVTARRFEVLSTTWKSTDGTVSHWKYIKGNAIVYRDVYRARVELYVPGKVCFSPCVVSYFENHASNVARLPYTAPLEGRTEAPHEKNCSGSGNPYLYLIR